MRACVFAIVVGLLPGIARADGICITIDAERDRLEEAEQAAAAQVLENAVLAAGGTIGTPCTETWQASHVVLGESVQILVVTPRGAFTASAPSLEALGDAYMGIAWRALVSSPPATAAVVEPAPAEVVPVDPDPPGEVFEKLKGVFYARVGYGASPSFDRQTGARDGPTIGIGYRRSIDRWLFDLSVMNLHAWRESSDFDSDYCVTFMSFGRLIAYRMEPSANAAFYYGGGLSFGESEVRIPNSGYTTSDSAYGVQVELAAGYEILRDKPVRVFFEAWVTLPLARTETTIYNPTGPSNQYRFWAPFLGLTTGLGF